MMIPKRNIFIDICLLIWVLLALSTSHQAAAQQDRSVHKAKVIEHWTPERIQAAQPRDLFLDNQGKAYIGSRKGGLTPYGQSPSETVTQGPLAADTSGPDISNLFPAHEAVIGSSSIFSAEVQDNEFESDTGVRSVSIVIQYPAGNNESFRASNIGANTWAVNLQGFTDSTGWSWWVEAKDKAKKGGNRSTSAVFDFDVVTGAEPPVEEPPTEEPPTEGIIENEQWLNGGAVQAAAGRIYFEMPGNSKRKGPWGGYVCSGSVIKDSDTDDSDNGRGIIITAAHCAYDDVNKAFARNVLFIPNQAETTGTRTDGDCTNDPMGCWAPHFAVIDDDWSSRTFPNNIPWDYAYYVVDDSDSKAHEGPGVSGLQAAAGNLPLSFASPYFNDGDPSPASIDFTHALGYSYSNDPDFMYCAEGMTTEDYKVGETENWWLAHCDLSGGSSGGPWLQPLTGGSGPIISVNSWGYTTQPGMAGPFLHSSSASCLLNIAEGTDFGSIDTADGEAGIKGPCD